MKYYITKIDDDFRQLNRTISAANILFLSMQAKPNQSEAHEKSMEHVRLYQLLHNNPCHKSSIKEVSRVIKIIIPAYLPERIIQGCVVWPSV